MLKFDLHIHSVASKYKESDGVVDNSTPDNIDVLLGKLNENEVALFSITDHNRFNVALYKKLDEVFANPQAMHDYPNVKGYVAGVEFDVTIDSTMGKCHIITIFDAQGNLDNYEKIDAVLMKNPITDPDASYTKQEFEEILRDIGLDTILIACQRSDMNRQSKKKHNSLSDSTRDPQALIQAGYINALEYQKPMVEGILQSNLREIDQQLMLVSGSDCHDWSVYPWHDKENHTEGFEFSKAKILPTFKGLVMAITSPGTRINRSENTNQHFLAGIHINGMTVPLVNGINAIIGENGSGKSTLLKLLGGETNESHVRGLIRDNAMSIIPVDPAYVEYIKQGEIVQKFESGSLFNEDSNYISVDTEPFRKLYTKYASELLTSIRKHIRARDCLHALSNIDMEFKDLQEDSLYYVSVETDKTFDDYDNVHTEPLKSLKNLLDSMNEMLRSTYFSEYYERLQEAYRIVYEIHDEVGKKSNDSDIEKMVRSTITSLVRDYLGKVTEASSSRDVECRSYSERKKAFVDSVFEAIKTNIQPIELPIAPIVMKGSTSNVKYGFAFNQEAYFNEKDLLQEFLSRIFVKQYASIDEIIGIDTIEDLVKAINGCTDTSSIEETYQRNVDAFINRACQCKKYIVDCAANSGLGNTLGELSLAYFKYSTSHRGEWCIFLIDQPEDHISNNNICSKLFDYISSIRYNKQIIFVTHNPLLVVNLDVDNVIFVSKRGKSISTISGCLEYEDDSVNILDIVATHMDGGKSSVEKRLRVYGKAN